MRIRTWKGLQRFWGSDVGLSAFLGFLVVLLFVAPSIPTLDAGRRNAVVGGVFTALLLSGVASISVGPVLRMGLGVLALAATVVLWGAFSPQATAAAEFVSIAAMAMVVLAQVFREGPVTAYRIQGAVAAYLLLGLAWALAYEFVALTHADAFAGSAAATGGDSSFVYFSFVTLTTVGYGDMTPVHPVARSLATAEALIGQLYPAILLARLVSLASTGESAAPPGGTPTEAGQP